MFYSQQGRGVEQAVDNDAAQSGIGGIGFLRPASLCGACAVKVSAPARLRSENLAQDATECSITTGVRLCNVFGIESCSHYTCYVDKWMNSDTGFT